jgi:dolichyl-phosphate beta-glucosyltransferase
MANNGLVGSLEQLVWLLCETAWERPFYFFFTCILPLASLAIFCVGNVHTRAMRPTG